MVSRNCLKVVMRLFIGVDLIYGERGNVSVGFWIYKYCRFQ